jgi:hypothetical protein
MFLPIPPSTIADLSAAHTPSSSRSKRKVMSEVDLFMVPDSLQPDPLYMGLRNLFVSGPIGRLIARWETWREVREDHLATTRQAVAAADSIVRQSPPSSIAARERIDPDLAA